MELQGILPTLDNKVFVSEITEVNVYVGEGGIVNIELGLLSW